MAGVCGAFAVLAEAGIRSTLVALFVDRMKGALRSHWKSKTFSAFLADLGSTNKFGP